jgi:deoxyribose-phosphate aldolase
MKTDDLFRYIDHTLLKPTATWSAIRTLCEEAITYRTASVCVPPCYVEPIRDAFGDKVNIGTVIGFPLGYCVTAVKVFEARRAIGDGAAEIDMVVNIAAIKNGDFDAVSSEIAELRAATRGKCLKVIVETCYLGEDEKRHMCRIVTDEGADFIKTSTGFGSAGATLADIALFRANIGPAVKIKAAGGVRSREDLEAFVAAGCARIGTSSAVGLLAGGTVKAAY